MNKLLTMQNLNRLIGFTVLLEGAYAAKKISQFKLTGDYDFGALETLFTIGGAIAAGVVSGLSTALSNRSNVSIIPPLWVNGSLAIASLALCIIGKKKEDPNNKPTTPEFPKNYHLFALALSLTWATFSASRMVVRVPSWIHHALPHLKG